MLWVPLRQRPVIGTLSNVVVVGLAVDASLAALPEPRSKGTREQLRASGAVPAGSGRPGLRG